MIKIFLTLALLTLSTTASSWGGNALVNGNKLWEFCEPDEANFSDGMCAGYILGVHDQGRYETYGSCIPNGVSAEQMIDLTRNYLRDNPAQRHKSGEALVAAAFTDAWPCPE